MRRALPLPVVGALCLVAFAVGLGIAHGNGPHRADPLAARVRTELRDSYYRPLPPQVLALGSVPAIIAALHDPYTEYLDPAAYRLIRLIEGSGRRIAYLRLASFRSGAASATATTLKLLERDGASAVVLDLRGNPGGLLSQAVAVSSLFLSGGTIVSIQGAHLRRVVYRATGGAATSRLPLAILIDRWSASSAEVVAAALHDNRRATLVGESTLGKGLVQTVRPLPNGGALKLTTARYLTPFGTDISGVGVPPDVPAYDDLTTRGDDALNAAIEAVTSR